MRVNHYLIIHHTILTYVTTGNQYLQGCALLVNCGVFDFINRNYGYDFSRIIPENLIPSNFLIN